MDIKDFTSGYRVIGALAKERITPSEFHVLLQDSGRLESYERVFKNRNRQEIVLRQSSALDAIAGNLDAYTHAPEPIRRAIQADELHMANLLAGVLGDDPETFDLDDVANYAGNQIAVELIVQSERLMNRIGASYAATEALLREPAGLTEVLNSEIAVMAISTNVGMQYVLGTPSVFAVWPEQFVIAAFNISAHKGLFIKTLLGSSDSMWEDLVTVVDIVLGNPAALDAIIANPTAAMVMIGNPAALDAIIANPTAAMVMIGNPAARGWLDVSNPITVPLMTESSHDGVINSTNVDRLFPPYSVFTEYSPSGGFYKTFLISGAEGFVGYDFGEPVWPYRFALIIGNTNGFLARLPQKVYLEATDDLSLGWEVAGEYTMGVDYPDEFPLNRDFFPATSIGRRRYWRIRAVCRIQGGDGNCNLDNLQFYCK